MGIKSWFGDKGVPEDGKTENAEYVEALIEERLSLVRDGRRARGISLGAWPWTVEIMPDGDYVEVKLNHKGLIEALVVYFASLGIPVAFEPGEVMPAPGYGRKLIGNPEGFWTVTVYSGFEVGYHHQAQWAALERDPAGACRAVFAAVDFAAYGR